MDSITKLLKYKANDEELNPALRGSLSSAIAGRQYPQARVFAVGWATHSKCLFCLHKVANLGSTSSRRTMIHGKTKPRPCGGVVIPDDLLQQEAVLASDLTHLEATRQNRVRHKVEATTEQVAAAPVGSLGHRICKCQA